MNVEATKSGFVAIVGQPNVGKSTLMNLIIGYKIAITSYKPQTTRYDIRTVLTDERGQIVFNDTPGVHKGKSELDQNMARAVMKSIKGADLILFLVSGLSHISELEREILADLKGKKVILAINKVDKIKKDSLVPIIDKYSKLFDFAEIIPISARVGTNVDVLVDNLYKHLPYGENLYDEDTLTDQPIRNIVAEIIREKALLLLNDEIPHGVHVYVDKMSTRANGLTDIMATIVCEKKSHKGIIIGKNGELLKELGTRARKDIEELIEGKCNLKLWVKVVPNWRDNKGKIRGFDLFVE